MRMFDMTKLRGLNFITGAKFVPIYLLRCVRKHFYFLFISMYISNMAETTIQHKIPKIDTNTDKKQQ